jgi:hypothetical protein
MRQWRRIGQSAARDARANPEVTEPGFVRAQAHLDVAQALPPGELTKGHAQKLIEAGEALGVAVAIVPSHRAKKGVQRQVLHELREDYRPSCMTASPWWCAAKRRANDVQIYARPETRITLTSSTTGQPPAQTSPDTTGQDWQDKRSDRARGVSGPRRSELALV